jgi:hypothetical protein
LGQVSKKKWTPILCIIITFTEKSLPVKWFLV